MTTDYNYIELPVTVECTEPSYLDKETVNKVDSVALIPMPDAKSSIDFKVGDRFIAFICTSDIYNASEPQYRVYPYAMLRLNGEDNTLTRVVDFPMLEKWDGALAETFVADIKKLCDNR